jgi:hypothetical protein
MEALLSLCNKPRFHVDAVLNLFLKQGFQNAGGDGDLTAPSLTGDRIFRFHEIISFWNIAFLMMLSLEKQRFSHGLHE